MSSEKQYKGEVEESKRKNSALNVNEGVESPPQVNPNIHKIRKYKKILSVDDYVKGIIAGDANILSQAITLIESKLDAHNEISQKIIEQCLKHSGNSIRIGITGVPGVGKSTFIEFLGVEIVNSGNKLAVLAVDPSSERSGGSILGDKTRMETLSAHPNAFIRPSPSAGSLGGVARKTRETTILCEAAGFNIIFVETVGVGQSETSVHSMVDVFLLLMLAGAGDELQGIKRGIMEMADIIAITKADGNNITKANLARVQYQNALHLFPPTEAGWIPKAITCSAVEKTGIIELWKMINDYIETVKNNKFFDLNRKKQSLYWMFETINETIKNDFYDDNNIKANIEKIKNDVLNDKISSFSAATTLLDMYLKR
jgi:LAO/AO transport system kinase